MWLLILLAGTYVMLGSIPYVVMFMWVASFWLRMLHVTGNLSSLLRLRPRLSASSGFVTGSSIALTIWGRGLSSHDLSLLVS